jgi:hypothetical protein
MLKKPLLLLAVVAVLGVTMAARRQEVDVS